MSLIHTLRKTLTYAFISLLNTEVNVDHPPNLCNSLAHQISLELCVDVAKVIKHLFCFSPNKKGKKKKIARI